MILQVQNVSYAYKANRSKQILKDVSCAFDCGKLYAILGPSGAGKTTLLSLLAGLDLPTVGQILYDGAALTAKNLRSHRANHVSLVFQSYNLIDYLTPLENVRLGGGKEAAALLESVGVGREFHSRKVTQLSGGQQQRVAIARALGSAAQVLLADEPTGNLDEATAWGIIDLMKRMAHQEGKCVIVVTHSSMLAREADEIMEIGTVISQNPA